jgi:hypothetical protein
MHALPVPLAPRFSEVLSVASNTRTALAVYVALEVKTAKAVPHSCVSYITQLKQGVNEISKRRVAIRTNEAGRNG